MSTTQNPVQIRRIDLEGGRWASAIVGQTGGIAVPTRIRCDGCQEPAEATTWFQLNPARVSGNRESQMIWVLTPPQGWSSRPAETPGESIDLCVSCQALEAGGQPFPKLVSPEMVPPKRAAVPLMHLLLGERSSCKADGNFTSDIAKVDCFQCLTKVSLDALHRLKEIDDAVFHWCLHVPEHRCEFCVGGESET